MHFRRTLIIVTLLLSAHFALAEPQEDTESLDYEGITDPFGDPFTDRRVKIEDAPALGPAAKKQGKTLAIGLDVGAGIFTQGLGVSILPAAYFGARIQYFFVPKFSAELSVHYGKFFDEIRGNIQADIDTTLIPLTLGLRYSFGNPESPVIKFANPFVVLGVGTYLRQQRPIDPSVQLEAADNSQFGFFAGLGVEIPIVKRDLFLGIDFRYHLIMFVDEDSTLGGSVAEGDRAGDFLTPVATVSYYF